MSTEVASGSSGQGGAQSPGIATGTVPSTSATTEQVPQTPVSDWTSGLDEQLKGFVQTKGFKGPGEVLNSYQNLEKLMGGPREKLIRIPDKADDPAWSDVWGKLGRPADAKEYNFEVPEGGDPKLAEWAKGTFHKLNLPKPQADALAKEWNAMANQVQAQQKEAYQNHLTQDTAALKKEWGAAFEQNVAVGAKAARAFGIDGDTIDKLEMAMGHAKVMKLMHTLGSKIGEDSFQGSNSSNQGFGSVMTPAQAKFKLEQLKADQKWVTGYLANESGPREEMAKLQQFIYGAE